MTTDTAARPPDHPPVAFGRVGVLLVNLGTPDATDFWSVRRYLSEFLSDRRVVELPRLLWQPILQGIILTTRPRRSGHAYAQIWDRSRNQSPLKSITEDQAAALQALLGPDVDVDWAMRYGNPSIAGRLTAMKARGCDRILIAPLYPQYSGATTASVVDKVGEAMMAMRWQPALRTLPPYYDDPGYIAALAGSVRARINTLDWEPEVLLASFHGMPRRTLDLGDPYHCHCQKTGRLLREALDWPAARFHITFQSRFGRAEWLRPYTDQTLRALAGKGVKRLAIIAPAFAADCIETLEELSLANRDLFLSHGGEAFAYVPCLNAGSDGMAMLAGLVRRELQGWI